MIHPSHQPDARRQLQLVAVLAGFLLMLMVVGVPRDIEGVRHFHALHSLLEILAISISAMIFAVGWRTHEVATRGVMLPVACLMLGVALLDTSHLLSYQGMPDFLTPNSSNKSISFWLAARLLSVLALLWLATGGWAPLQRLQRPMLLGIVLLLVLACHAWFLLTPEWVPVTFIPGQGLTTFKMIFEAMLIAGLLFAAWKFLGRLNQPASNDDLPVVPLLATVLVLSLSGVCFMIYVDITGFYNLVGHVYKIIGYLLLYRAVFVSRVEMPHRRLSESEAEMRAVLAAIPDPLFEVDAEGRYLRVHARDDSLLAAPAEQLVGRLTSEVLPPEAWAACRQALEAAAQSGVSRGLQASMLMPDGSERWFEMSVARIPGALQRFVAISRDVTPQRESRRRLALQARRAEALLSLAEAAEQRDERGFMQYGLEIAEQLTDSRIAFIHFVNEDQETLELVTWSHETLAKHCTAAYDSHYPISSAGIWADAFRQRAPVVHNDYAAAPHKRGLPPGHAAMLRLISVPVLSDGKVRMMAGVGNRETPYGDDEVETVQLIADAIWRIAIQRRTAEALVAERIQLEAFFDTNLDLLCVANVQGRLLRLNTEWERVLGFPLGTLVGASFIDYVHPEDREGTLAAMRELREPSRVANFENRFRCADGSWRWLEWRSQPQGELIYAAARDVTERRRIEAELRKLSAAVEQDPNPVVITDLSGSIEYVNPAFTRVTGYPAAEVLGRNPRLLQSGETAPEVYISMWKQLAAGEAWRGELTNRRRDGSVYAAETLIYPVRDATGTVLHYLAHSEDVSERKLADARIRQLSNFDQLTGLANPTLLRERVQQALDSARRQQSGLALLSIDLDHFKTVNDTLGHAQGDLVLMEMAARLLPLLEDGQTLARVSGDEFMVVLPEATQARAGQLAWRIVCAVAEPLPIAGQDVIVTASVGIALYPEDGAESEVLLRNAAAAMRRVKQDSRNGYRFFTAELEDRSARLLGLGSALHQALARRQLRVVYQPQIDLDRGAAVAVEALLRWQHPRWGDIPPAEFIPIAEDNGLIVPIGAWVLESALQQLARWQREGLREVRVAVNVSALQFRHPQFLETVERLLQQTGVDPAGLELELTEAVAMRDPLAAIAIIDRLHRRGVQLSIDDFGTGYSSLSQLKRFRISKLKIDQSFIRELPTDPDDQAIVTAIIQMAHSLGVRTLAEGVETAAQLGFLREQGCDGVQGHLYSRPLEAAQAERYLREHGQRRV